MPEYPTYPNGLRQRDPYQEAGLNVPEWAGRYPNVYGAMGAAYEAMGRPAGLGAAVGYGPPQQYDIKQAAGEAMNMAGPLGMGIFPRGLLGKAEAAVRTRPQAHIYQDLAANRWYVRTGLGSEQRTIVSGKTLEEAAQKAKQWLPGHDIRIIR